MKRTKHLSGILFILGILCCFYSCNDRDERLFVDDDFSADSLKTLVAGNYVVMMKGLTFLNNQMVECPECSHFTKRLKLNSDFSWQDSTIFTPKDSVVENRTGKWEFVNKNIIALHSTDDVEIILEKDSTNLFLRVFRFKGQIIPPGEQPLYVKQSEMKEEQTLSPEVPSGAFFKAHGNEPFWMLELFEKDQNHASRWLEYTPMEGEKLEMGIENPKSEMIESGVQIMEYQSVDRTAQIKIRNVKTNDGMSEKEYWYKVDLTLSDKKLNGVGEYADTTKNGPMSSNHNQRNSKIAASSIYKKWMLQTINGKPFQSSKPAFIELGMDGAQFTGNSGCNSLFGKFELKNNTLRFLNIGSTKMACQGMDEMLFMTNLSDNHTFVLTTDEMTLTNSKGVKLVFLSE